MEERIIIFIYFSHNHFYLFLSHHILYLIIYHFFFLSFGFLSIFLFPLSQFTQNGVDVYNFLQEMKGRYHNGYNFEVVASCTSFLASVMINPEGKKKTFWKGWRKQLEGASSKNLILKKKSMGQEFGLV